MQEDASSGGDILSTVVQNFEPTSGITFLIIGLVAGVFIGWAIGKVGRDQKK